MRMLSIGSVSPKHGGKTEGGVAEIHSILSTEFVKNPDLEIEIVGIIATNSDNREDPINEIPYFSNLPGETRLECIQRLVDSYNVECIFVHHIAHSWASALSHMENPPMCIGYVHSLNAINPINPNYKSKIELLNQSKSAFDLLIFNSPNSFNRSLEMGINFDCKIKILIPSVSQSFIDQPISEKTQNNVIFVGRLDENKGIHKLILAIMSCESDLMLTIVGQGPLQPEVIHSIEGCKNKINYIPYLESEELAKIICKAAILCVPSKYESFGLVYAEALCLGVPIIGFGPSIEFIEKELGLKCGVGIIEQSVQSISNAIQEISNLNWDKIHVSNLAREKFHPLRQAKELSLILHQIKTKRSGE